jgi:hypothetical protein
VVDGADAALRNAALRPESSHSRWLSETHANAGGVAVYRFLDRTRYGVRDLIDASLEDV